MAGLEDFKYKKEEEPTERNWPLRLARARELFDQAKVEKSHSAKANLLGKARSHVSAILLEEKHPEETDQPDLQGINIQEVTNLELEILIDQGWALWRLKRYEEVYEIATNEPVGNTQEGLRLQAYLFSHHASSYRDAEKLRHIIDRLEENDPVRRNALMVFDLARDENDEAEGEPLQTPEDILAFVRSAQEDVSRDPKNSAHNLQNAALWVHLHTSESENFQEALVWLEKALPLYGNPEETENAHHIAGLYHRKALLLKDLDKIDDAVIALEQSNKVWDTAIEQDPENQAWKENKQKNEDRIKKWSEEK